MSVGQGSSLVREPKMTPRRVRAPRVHSGTWAEAHDLARKGNEPIFVPITPYVDDRGWSLMNLMVGVLNDEGQINFSLQHPGIVKAWHRHQKQTDFWCCAVGHLKTGVYREDDDTAWMLVMGEQRPGVMVIPPPLWHGAAAVGAGAAGLLYYVTRAYDASEPDEERREWDSVPGFPWTPRNG